MRLALLGDPVEHSRSPAIHRAALAALGIEGEYLARRVDRAGLGIALDEIRTGVLDGANITMPHKRAAADLCEVLHDDAAAGRAVNTIARRTDGLVGWNTDVLALRSLAARFGEASFIVLGAGGAAAGALVALAGRAVAVAARRPDEAARLLATLSSDAAVTTWGDLAPGAVVVNATPLGMQGEPLPVGLVESAAALIDLPYGPEPTPATVTARRLEIPCVDGLEFLVAQAAESFRIWTGREPPLAAMASAAGSF